MKLHGIDFGPIWGASGVQGFWGEGYPFHRIYRMLFPGFTFDGVTFVTKTVTLEPRKGFMELRRDGTTPRRLRPDCVIVDFRQGFILNAVGLSNFGIHHYLGDGRWQARTKPFIISVMLVKPSKAERLDELRRLVRVLLGHLHSFKAPIALQINYSCPNTGHNLDELMEEVEEGLEIASALCIPLIPKFNILVSPDRVASIASNMHCDAICISNTVPWGEFPARIPWKRLFGTETSPLAKYGGGGLSGAPITEIVREWVYDYSMIGGPKLLNAGGGIMNSFDVDNLIQWDPVGSVFIGSAATLRPWRLRSIIRTAHK